jgi:hypothetical protein
MTMLVVGLLSFALGLLSAVLGERRRDRRMRRRIARALIPDLLEVSGSMLFMNGSKKWDSVEMPPTKWDEYRDALGEAVKKPREWFTISSVFEGVRELGEEAERHEWPEEIDPIWMQGLEDLYQSIGRAVDLLHRYAGVLKPPGRVRRLRLRQRLRSLRLA